MGNLKSWAIVIFVLNSHISCETSSSNTWKKKKTKKNKNPVSCHHLTQLLHCFASKHAAVTWSRRPLNSMSLSFLLFTCATKSTITKLNVAKNLPKCFSLMVTFLYSRFKIKTNTSIAATFYWGTHPQHHGVISTERKVTRTLFIVTVVSSILLMPGTTAMFLHAVSSSETFKTVFHHTFLQLNYSVFFLFCCNSFINPLLYTSKMPEFKRTLLLLLRCPSRSGQTSRS